MTCGKSWLRPSCLERRSLCGTVFRGEKLLAEVAPAKLLSGDPQQFNGPYKLKTSW